MEDYSAIKKKTKTQWHLTTWSNMDGSGGYYAKWNKLDESS